ncbi:MAG: cation:proton antiporter [Candidatus Erginobacter occultus]|nr:cation:proton antiporter [Candidatus Erginobacter occultus]
MGTLDFGVLFILGVGAFGGILGASLFQHFRIPQVVGYIAIGLLIGRSGLGIVGPEDIVALGLFNLFALGLIGFMVGGELRLGTLQRYRKQFVSILLGEGLGAFFLTGLLTGAAVWYLTRDGAISLAAGIVFGAIASATDPASTIDVLWEYRARGVLTTTLIAIVALDDALAMTLYGLGTSTAGLLTGGTLSLGEVALKIGVDLFGAVVLGFLLGCLLNFIFRWMRQKEKTLGTALGAILLAIGIAVAAEMDIILATMALGVTLTNLAPRRSKELFSLAQSFSSPIYVVFFVLVGARLDIGGMPLWLWGVVGLYVIGRSLGKIGGAGWGARIMHSPPAVQRYSGIGLFAQGGIAVGLSIMASQHLGAVEFRPGMTLGDMIIFTVTASTLIVQILGPPLVKLAVKRAGEAGRNVTEEDILSQWTVRNLMDRETRLIREEEPIAEIIRAFSEHDDTSYPVVGPENRMVGIITLERIQNVLTSRDTWRWLVASDVMIPVREKITASSTLKDALELMEQLKFEQIPVVSDDGQDRAVGVLDRQKLKKRVSEEVWQRQNQAPAT